MVTVSCASADTPRTDTQKWKFLSYIGRVHLMLRQAQIMTTRLRGGLLKTSHKWSISPKSEGYSCAIPQAKDSIAANIEKAFLVRISGYERGRKDTLCYLWIDDIAKESPSFIRKRFNRVFCGVNINPFLLSRTSEHHISRSNIRLIQKSLTRCSNPCM